MTQYPKVPAYAAEDRIREVAAAAGVRPECLDDVVMRFRDFQFTEAELPAKIAEWRETPGHHFFNVGRDDGDNELFIRAFGPHPSLTARGEVVRKLGEAKAAEVAAQFGTTLASIKPGTVPEHIKIDSANSTNPFLKLRDASGKIDPVAAAKVDKLIKALGTRKAEAIARSVNRTITGLPLKVA